MKTSEVLHAAADVVGYQGWRKWGGGWPQAVAAYLGGVEPFMWNDTDSRTEEEVIEVLRATALVESAREDADVAEPVGAL